MRKKPQPSIAFRAKESLNVAQIIAEVRVRLDEAGVGCKDIVVEDYAKEGVTYIRVRLYSESDLKVTEAIVRPYTFVMTGAEILRVSEAMKKGAFRRI